MGAITPILGGITQFEMDCQNTCLNIFWGFLGLSLELYVEQGEYIPELTEGAGFIITNQEQHVMPFPQDEGVPISPGELTYMSLTLVSLIPVLPGDNLHKSWHLS